MEPVYFNNLLNNKVDKADYISALWQALYSRYGMAIEKAIGKVQSQNDAYYRLSILSEPELDVLLKELFPEGNMPSLSLNGFN